MHYEKRPHPLSPRETQVSILVNRGLSVKEIAAEMHVTRATASLHMRRIYNKLAIHNMVQLALMVERGEISSKPKGESKWEQ